MADRKPICKAVFFFNDTATTEIYTLSLTRRSSDLISGFKRIGANWNPLVPPVDPNDPNGPNPNNPDPRPNTPEEPNTPPDRKSTRLNSSHANISYAVFCLKKKNLGHGGYARVHRRP